MHHKKIMYKLFKWDISDRRSVSDRLKARGGGECTVGPPGSLTKVPSERKKGCLVKLPKQGDLSSCSKYREITLLSIPGKVFSGVLLNRMKDAVDPQLWDQQAGFCRDRFCTDQIARLRIILEQRLQHCAPPHNSHANGTALSTSTLLTMRRHLTVWTDMASGNCWDTIAYQRSPASLETPTVEWHAEWYVIANWQTPFSKDRSDTWMSAVALPIPTGHRLGVEDRHSPEGKWNSVDSLAPASGPKLCRWPGSPLPYPATDAREDCHGGR